MLPQSAGVPYTLIYIYIYVSYVCIYMGIPISPVDLYRSAIQWPRNLALRLSTRPWLMLRTWPMSLMATPTRSVLFCAVLPGYPMPSQKLPTKEGYVYLCIYIYMYIVHCFWSQTLFLPQNESGSIDNIGDFKVMDPWDHGLKFKLV